MQMDQASARDLQAGLLDNSGLIWTAGILLRIRRLGVRVPPSAPRSTVTFGHGMHCCGSSCSSEVQQCLAVKLLSQPAKRLAGGLVGDLGVDLHGDRDLAVAEYPHRYPRVHVEGGQQRGAGAAHSVGRDVADPGSTARGL